jgi:hypothetical protein
MRGIVLAGGSGSRYGRPILFFESGMCIESWHRFDVYGIASYFKEIR